jgi:hypothetical protein
MLESEYVFKNSIDIKIAFNIAEIKSIKHKK